MYRLSVVVVHDGYSLVAVLGLLIALLGPFLLQNTGSRAHRLQ